MALGENIKSLLGSTSDEEGVSNRILTIPNVISFVRLCCIPVFFVLLVNEYNIAATILFAVAAATDWVDGKVARATNSVTKLGQVLDPAIDRLLMISGGIGLLIVGRLPLWIFILVIARDVLMLIGGVYILNKWKLRVRVIYLGKIATTFLYVGFVGLLLNDPIIPGLGLVSAAWLPGFNSMMFSWAIWPVYIGLVLAIITTAHYCRWALREIDKAKLSASSVAGEVE
ncbi:MAG: CDP-alcohol phosphatidyltransferase family protein [Eggerthellaceae bacterium]|nr:CDP-alcohol phosphatidyltransferase family protein [Eggerthellaceae bacterium]